ncbi:UNVERIFIED_CONTAM: hypothetical protein Sindi_3032300, partial [Sesamum indicum]
MAGEVVRCAEHGHAQLFLWLNEKLSVCHQCLLLEIHEIPFKSPPLDFGKLSISDASLII